MEKKRGFYKLRSYRLSDKVIEEIESRKNPKESYNQLFERLLKIQKYDKIKRISKGGDR